MTSKEMKVENVMRDVHTISFNSTYKKTLEKMIALRTNSLVVVNDEGEFVGMVNARILIEKAIPKYLGGDEIAAHFADEDMFREEIHKQDNVSIKEFMATDIAVIDKDDSLVKAALLATKNQQIRIPVLDDNKKPIGLLTRTELKQVIGYYMGIDGSLV